MSDAAEWLLVGLDEKMARRQGVPARIPVPKGEFEGITEKGLHPDQLKVWITAFLGAAPSAWRGENVEMARGFDRFLAKLDIWGKAQKAFAKQDFKTAISSLKMVCNLDPDDHAAKMNLASALASTGDAAGALKLLESVRATFEGEADYHTMLGQLLVAAGNTDQAIDELVLALEAKPDQQAALDALKQLGVLIAVYEDPRDANSLAYFRADSLVEALEGVWDEKPRDVEYYLGQAGYHASEERHPVALAAADRAIALAKDGGDGARAEPAESARIQALAAMGRLAEARTSAEAFVARAPDSSLAHVLLAQTIGEQDPAAAKIEIDRALELDPGNLLALDLAFWPKDKNDIAKIAEALPGLWTFVEKHTDNPGALRSFARGKLAIGATDEGLDLLARAVSLDPTDDDLRSEHWTELGKNERFPEILEQAAAIPDIGKRDWRLRWNEAEAYSRAGKKMEARTAFSAINLDTSLRVDIRKRAKRAATAIAESG
jgi:tetratricopeptide (TPR) repeat protein